MAPLLDGLADHILCVGTQADTYGKQVSVSYVFTSDIH